MSANPQSEWFRVERLSMVEAQLRARGIRDSRVLGAMAQVPREEFVAAALRRQAYEDHPLPIGEGQTISQPYIVAVTLEGLALTPEDVVLEIGAGSGYQTALLAELCGQVYSIERHQSLVDSARAVLDRLGYNNVAIEVGDGSQGLPRPAPFDAIAVSAAAPQIPPPLFDQLKEGGRMVIPVGPEEAQQLQLVEKKQGVPFITVLEPCRFVPLIGTDAYPAK